MHNLRMTTGISGLQQIEIKIQPMSDTEKPHVRGVRTDLELDLAPTADSILSETLGLLPMGSYLMTAACDDQRAGMLVHSVQRCCDEPILLCVAARKGHAIDPLIRDSRSFAIGIVPPEDRMIARKFRFDEMVVSQVIQPIIDDPFEAIPTRTLATGSPIIARCPIWFDCEVVRRVDLETDHELFIGRVLSILHNGERIDIEQVPMITDND